MEQDSLKLKHDVESNNVFDYLKKIDKLQLVSFISQIPLPIALLDKNARILGVNQKFSDIYESDALYLSNKLLSTFSSVVYTQFRDALKYWTTHDSAYEQEFYVKGCFYLAYFNAIYSKENEIELIILVCADVTRLKRRENVLLQNNKKLHDHLYLDFVTGLQNQIAFDHYLNRLFQQKRVTNYSFLKIDIDDFKRYNQANSYTQGDEVLAQLGVVLNAVTCQTEAKIFRHSSASFIVVLESMSEWTAITLAERFKFAVLDQKIKFDQSDDYLTVSVGVYHFKPTEKHKNEDILKNIEIALRKAKTLGGNALFILNDEL